MREAAAAGPPNPAPDQPADAAGPVAIVLQADRIAVTIGDPITLTFTVRHPHGYQIVSFDPDRSLDALTLLDNQEGPPQTLPDGRIEVVRRVTLAAYETGRKELPPVAVVYRSPSGEEGKAATSALGIEVASVLSEGQKEPADIKPQAVMPGRSYWPWVALLVVILLAAAAILWWRRRRRPPAEATVIAPAVLRPAHEIAYAELERLLSSGLLEKSAVKEFYIELAEILRRYLAARYGIDTFERTTEEVLQELRVARIPLKISSLARELLAACDLVKFARSRPSAEETRRSVEAAYRLVDETRPAPLPAEPAAPATLAAGGAA